VKNDFFNRADLEKSFVHLLHWASGRWEDRHLKINSPFFKEEILNMFADQKI